MACTDCDGQSCNCGQLRVRRAPPKAGGVRRRPCPRAAPSPGGRWKAQAVAAGRAVAGTVEAGEGGKHVFARSSAGIPTPSSSTWMKTVPASVSALTTTRPWAWLFEGVAQQIARGIGQRLAVDVGGEILRWGGTSRLRSRASAQNAHTLDLVGSQPATATRENGGQALPAPDGRR